VVTDGRALFYYDVARDFLQEVARGGNIAQPKLLDQTHVSFIQGASSGSSASLMVIDVPSRQVRTIFTIPSGIRAYGWSPDGQVVAYVTTDARDFPLLRYRRVEGDQTTRSVATLARAMGRDFEPSDQVLVDWSRDGQRVLVCFTPADGEPDREVPADQSQLQVRSATGSLLFAADHADEPTMAAWASRDRRLYYRTDGGARVWDSSTGAVSGVAGGTRWFDPWVSPDGALLAYDTGQGSARARVRVLDLRTGITRTVGPAGRYHPVFASANVLWTQALRRCTGACIFPVTPTRDVYATSLRTSKERAITIGKLSGVDVFYA
jgi:WD40 repeat protein